MARILIIEDEVRLAEIIRKGLKDEKHSVDIAFNGEDGLWAAQGNEYDVIILDLMLPLLSGLDICNKLRADGCDTPIIMLTAKGDTSDIVKGLDQGANDYLTKPFAFEELIARVRSLLRVHSSHRSSKVSIGPLSIDFTAHKVGCGEEVLELSKKEYQLLETLARKVGEVVSKNTLVEALWERDTSPDSNQNAVEVYIAQLRKKLGKEHGHKLIKTKRGIGYELSWEEA